MKKRLFVLILTLITLATVTACSLNDVTEPIKDEVNDMMPNNQQGENGKQQDAQNKDDAKQTQSSVTPDTSSFIGEDKAREIALNKAGITADGVSFGRTELEQDNGVWKYEIEFKKDGTEYDAEIKADDGTILSWNVEKND